ncbi:hypothetical protein [Paenibacillus sp. BAC0078]
MEKGWNDWIDALSEQDIPAEVVDWENIVKSSEEDELDGDSRRLDAESTIGEPPAAKE